MIGETRAKSLHVSDKKGTVVYWMSRDQRVSDNWSLTYSQSLAESLDQELRVVFTLAPSFLEASKNQFDFMERGLVEVSTRLSALGIPFDILIGDPTRTLPKYIPEMGVGTVVMDQDPLKPKVEWRQKVMEEGDCSFVQVDAHNIVPVWVASPKAEYAAGTFRPKAQRVAPRFFSKLPHHVHVAKKASAPYDGAEKLPERSSPVDGQRVVPGEGAAHRAMLRFVAYGLAGYEERRNDPNLEGQSGLSPYLHFGMLSTQRLALAVFRSPVPERDKNAFLEELFIRRELADNFCYYTPEYDSEHCFPAWAKQSLQEHLVDRREYIYTLQELEAAKTHDPLWNAAQRQMLITGSMHGYMRMYWAKKLLEWSETSAIAYAAGIYLNNKYMLDGRDPNGYVGLAWSIGGLHDRAWPTRPIFGKVRYMSEGGARSKFDVDGYITRWT
ncbi:MAG: Deoxyribodipyrimidine photo-lyase [Methanomassiliicoccales archaeon PtaU1.Bin124]|nr:MAG: Deoxyribodipyrimidine photo-lyase [Methanomassiliicoccales archaeon PtaU1.Bin124]